MNPANRVLIRFLYAREFPNDEALQQYFKEHPKAKKELHWTKEKKRPQKDELAFIQDWQESREKELEEFRIGNFTPKTLTGKISPSHVKDIRQNIINTLKTYTHNLPADDGQSLRDLADMQSDLLKDALDSDALKDIDAEEINKVLIKTVHDLAYQTHESYRRSLGDHGIRHIKGNIDTQNNIFDALEKSGKKIPPLDRLKALLVQVNHDLGYTAAPAKADLRHTGKHKSFSSDIFQSEYQDEYEKIFGEKETEGLIKIIETHDSSDIDWDDDPIGSAVRIADNLSLYTKEKLPGLFKLIPGAIDQLEELGDAYRKASEATDEKKKQEAEKDGEKVKLKLEKMVNSSSINAPLKKALNNAVKEVTISTAKFTLGMLGGKLGDMEFKDNALNITIEQSEYETRLQKVFDMGQKQFAKLAEAYGYDKNQVRDAKEFEFKRDGKTLIKVSLASEKAKKEAMISPFLVALRYIGS